MNSFLIIFYYFDTHISKLCCPAIDAVNDRATGCNSGPHLHNRKGKRTFLTSHTLHSDTNILRCLMDPTTHHEKKDLLCSLFGTQVSLVLVGRWSLRAASRLVHKLPKTLGVIPH